MVCNLRAFLSHLKYLKRLSEIGKATEKAFKLYNQSYFAIGRDYGLDTEVGGIISNAEELLEWSEREEDCEK